MKKKLTASVCRSTDPVVEGSARMLADDCCSCSETSFKAGGSRSIFCDLSGGWETNFDSTTCSAWFLADLRKAAAAMTQANK